MNWLKQKLAGAFLNSFLGSLAKSNDTRATILGAIAGAIVLLQVDWSKVFSGDGAEIGKLAGAAVAAAIGYVTNRPDKEAKEQANRTAAGTR